MEIELEIPTQLFGGPPVLDNVVKMGESQIGFMNIYARPLFEAVTHILPAMKFSIDEILANKFVWEQKIKKEKECENHDHIDGVCVVQSFDGVASPLSGSHVELPGTDPLSTSLTADVQSQEEENQPGFSRSDLELPGTEPLSTSLTADVQSREEENRPGNDSDPALTAFLITQKQTLGSPGERRKKEKSFGPRLRSISPSKRKAKSKDRSSSRQEGSRPRTSPANSGNGLPTTRTSQSQPDIHYSQMNGHVIPSTNDGATQKPNNYLISNSTTDVSSNGQMKNRLSKFGFGKLWRKKWRTTGASHEQASTRLDDDTSTTEGK
jgi:hypothetical protein